MSVLEEMRKRIKQSNIESSKTKSNTLDEMRKRVETKKQEVEAHNKKVQDFNQYIKENDVSNIKRLQLPNLLSSERVRELAIQERAKQEEIEYYKNNPATFGSNLDRNLVQPFKQTLKNISTAALSTGANTIEYFQDNNAFTSHSDRLLAMSEAIKAGDSFNPLKSETYNKTLEEEAQKRYEDTDPITLRLREMRNKAIQETQNMKDGLGKKIAEGSIVVGDMLPAISLGMVTGGVGSSLAIYGNAAQNAYQQAIGNGATHQQASNNAALNGILEVLIEMLSGGSLNKLIKLPRGINFSGWTQQISNQFLRNGLNFVGDIVGEGLEEVVSTELQPIIDQITYNPNAPLATLKEDWEAFSSSIIPTIMFVGMNIGSSNVISYVDKQMTVNSVNKQIDNLANNQIQQIENTDLSMVEKISLINEVKKQQVQTKNNFSTEINKFEVTYPEKNKNIDAQIVNANVNKNLDELRTKHNVTINQDGTTNLVDRLKIKYNVQNGTNFEKTSPNTVQLDENNVQNVSNLQKTLQNNNVEKNIDTIYNQNRGEMNEQVQQERMLGNNNEQTRVYENNKQEQVNKYTREQYAKFEQSIKPIENDRLSAEERELINEYNNKYGKELVVFDSQENGYAGGASLTNNKTIFIDVNSAKEFGYKRIATHEVMESDILHDNKTKEIMQPAIEKIVNDPNFEKQKVEFWDNQEGEIPSDYLIAKDIICDRFAELENNEQNDYNNVLSTNTKNIIDDAINEYKKFKNSEEQGSFSMDEDVKYSRKNDTLDSYKTNAERISALIEQRIVAIEKGNVERQEGLGVIGRKEIRQKIERYLRRPIRTGGFREKAYAIYKPAIQSIRTKQLTDIDSIIHELGHHIDLAQLHITPNMNTRSWKKENQELTNELNKLCEIQFGTIYDNKPKVKLEEGFAEFTRRYVIDTENAIKTYPHIADLITEARERNTELDKLFDTLISDINTHVNMKPEERVISNVSINEDENKDFSIGKFIDMLMTEIYDENWHLKKAVNKLAQRAGKGNIHKLKPSENAYILFRLANSGTDQTTNMLGKGIRDWDTNEKITKGFSEVLEPIIKAEDMMKLRALLIAQRNKDYVKKGQQTGIRKQDAISTVKLLEKDSKIKDVADAFRKENDGILEYAKKEGLLDEKQIRQIKKLNENYIAMNRVMDDEGKIISASTKGAKVGKTVYNTTGSDREIVDPIESTITNASRIIRQVENNKVLKTLINLAKESNEYADMFEIVPPPMEYKGSVELSKFEKTLQKQGVDTTELNLEEVYNLFNIKLADDRNKIMSYIENGKRIYIQFYDENLYNVLKGMNGQNMGVVEKFLNFANAPLRYGATMANAEFSMPNAISDSQQAFLYSDTFFIPGVDNILGIINTLTGRDKTFSKFINKIFPQYTQKQKEFYDLYIQSGASQSGRFSPYRRKIRENATEVYDKKRKILFGKFDNKTGTYKASPTKVKGILNLAQTLVNKAMDVMTYASELTEESTRFQNFRKEMKLYKKKGLSNRDIRLKSAINAKDITQDFGRTGRTMRSINRVIPFSAARVGSAYRLGEAIHSHPARTSLRMAIIVALGLAIKAFTDDKENKHVEELTDQKKKDNFIIAYDKTSEPLTIKKIQGPPRSLINLSEYLYDLINGKLKGKEGEKLVEWMSDTIFDILPADDLGNMTPQIIKPPLENWLNKDFYYKTDLIPQNLQGLKPKDQYDEYTSEFAILLGNVLNYSPIYIDNLIEGYFAGVGSQILDGLDKILDVTDKGEQPDKNKSEQFILKRFFASGFRSGASIDEVYDLSKELTIKKEYNEATKKELEQLKDLEKAKITMSRLNKEIKAVRNNLSLNGSQKKEKINELQELRTDTARYYLGKTLIKNTNKRQIELYEYYPASTEYKYKPKNGLQVNVQYTEKDQQRYAEIWKETYEEELLKFETSKKYYTLTDEEREKEIESIKTKARNKAQDEVSKEVYEREH